jgi:mRNA-degrading endonuclease RelE of RelBE toxin-antitoxin system
MKNIQYSFRETPKFTKKVLDRLTDEEYQKLQIRLCEFPDSGDLIKGSGGLRKIRQAAKGKGTRGGSRVIYYFALVKETFYMLDVYVKNEKDDLSQVEIKNLRMIVEEWLRQ